jgi:uncharacterized membrane protein
MNLSAYALAVDALALLAAAAGFAIAFRQAWVRSIVRRLSGRAPDMPRREREEGEDPVHYAMIIAGVMLMAFGVIMFAFTTSFALLTAPS